MPMRDHIYQYELLTPFTTEGSGTAQWCKARHGGETFFIKQFLSPTQPPAGADMSRPVNRAKRDACIAFFRARQRLYNALREANTGALVCPNSVDGLFVWEGHYCSVSRFITPDVPPEAICRLPERVRVILMRTLTLALAGLHRQGIVHSDLKPDNVMVTVNENRACNLKLIDFDGSFFADTPPSRTDELHGDLAYLAPEALRFLMEEPVRLTAAVDVFALGLVLHAMWCGRLPRFDGTRARSAGEACLLGLDVLPDPALPEDLRRLIARMLQADPARRPAMPQVYDALGRLLALYPYPG